MNYKRHYDELIRKHGVKNKPEYYSERHHIIPKSMGGTDDEDNLVYLTFKAHYTAHHLLWKIYGNKSMAFAFTMMSGKRRIKPKSINKAQSLVRHGSKLSSEHKEAISTFQKGRPKPEGFGDRLSERLNEKHHLSKQVSIDGVVYKSSRKAAEALGISHRTVGRMVKRGRAFYLTGKD